MLDDRYRNVKFMPNYCKIQQLLKNIKSSNWQIIFYTKCLKQEHVEIKHKWLMDNLKLKELPKYEISELNKIDIDLEHNINYAYSIDLDNKFPCRNASIVIDDRVDNLLQYGKKTIKCIIAQS